MSVRQRTVEHMKQLLAAAALTASCSKDDSLAIKSDDGKSKALKKEDDSPAKPDAAPSITASTPTGYAVVDPLPPPVCPGVAATIITSTKTSGATIEVTLANPTFPASSFDKSAPTVYGGKLVSHTLASGGLALKIVPDATSTFISFMVPIRCAGKLAHVQGSFDPKSPAPILSDSF